MKKLISAAALASLALVGCDLFDSGDTSGMLDRGATARDGGVGGGIVSSLEYKIGTDGYLYWRLPNYVTYENWEKDATLGKVKAVEGGYVNERPEGIDTQSGFVIDEAGNTFRSSSEGWKRVYGVTGAIDLGTGDGQTFVVNVNGDIFKFDPDYNDGEFLWFSSLSSLGLPNNAVRLDVDADGAPWIVSDDAKVYKYVAGTEPWELKGESPTYKGLDIACGNAEVYVAAKNKDSHVSSIFRFGDTGNEYTGWSHYPDRRALKLDMSSADTLKVVDLFGGLASYTFSGGELIREGFEFDATSVNAVEIGNLYSVSE